MITCNLWRNFFLVVSFGKMSRYAIDQYSKSISFYIFLETERIGIEKQFVDKCKMCTTNSYILKSFVKDRARQYQDTTEVNFLLVILWIYCVHLCCVVRFLWLNLFFLKQYCFLVKKHYDANKYVLLTDIKLKCQRIQYQW